MYRHLLSRNGTGLLSQCNLILHRHYLPIQGGEESLFLKGVRKGWAQELDFKQSSSRRLFLCCINIPLVEWLVRTSHQIQSRITNRFVLTLYPCSLHVDSTLTPARGQAGGKPGDALQNSALSSLGPSPVSTGAASCPSCPSRHPAKAPTMPQAEAFPNQSPPAAARGRQIAPSAGDSSLWESVWSEINPRDAAWLRLLAAA